MRCRPGSDREPPWAKAFSASLLAVIGGEARSETALRDLVPLFGAAILLLIPIVGAAGLLPVIPLLAIAGIADR